LFLCKFVYGVTQKSLDNKGNTFVEFYWHSACAC